MTSRILAWSGLFAFLTAACSAPVPVEDASAHWISTNVLVWNVSKGAAAYHLQVFDTLIAITPSGAVADSTTEPYRKLAGWPEFRVDMDDALLREAIRGSLVAVATDNRGRVLQTSRVQFAGLLDDRYAYSGDLGPVYHPDRIEVSVWAPTAQMVSLNLYSKDKTLISTVRADSIAPAPGVWRFTVGRERDRVFYTFSVTVYHPETDSIQTLEVTDPYSASLSANGRHSQFVDLSGDRLLKPSGWDQLRKRLPRATDITLYEGHVRDFSIFDESVPAAHRGKYLAFTHVNSTGMRHLKRLADAGLSHLHLLPVNDIGSVNEIEAERVDLSDSLRAKFAAWAEADPRTERIQQPYSQPSRAGWICP